MTDQELQDLLDRLDDGGSTATPPPDAEDTADWKAYRLLYAALEEEPEGTLPPDFAEQVADRVMPAPAPASVLERFAWLEWVLPPLALIAAFVATLLLIPAVGQTGAEAVRLILDPLAALWTELRLDIALTAGIALLLIALIDRFVLQHWFHRSAAPA